jgi:hypothetical protein
MRFGVSREDTSDIVRARFAEASGIGVADARRHARASRCGWHFKED